MSEAERMEDYGDLVILEELRERQGHILDIKTERLNKLIGRYVVVTNGRGGKTLYLQDRNISKALWWTNFLDCAFGFVSGKEAEKVKSKYKYNNPRVVKVTKEMVVNAKEELESFCRGELL